MTLSEKAGVTSSVACKVASTLLRKHGIDTSISKTTTSSASENGALRLKTAPWWIPRERLDSIPRVVTQKEMDVHAISVLFPKEKRGLCSAILLQRLSSTLTFTTPSETAYRREGVAPAPQKKRISFSRGVRWAKVSAQCWATCGGLQPPFTESPSSRARRLRRCREAAR